MHTEAFPSHKQKQAAFISLLAMKLGMSDVSKGSSCRSCFFPTPCILTVY